MRTGIMGICTAIALTVTAALAAPNGKALYGEFCADECHKPSMFADGNRKAASVSELAAWVHNCAEMVEAGWSAEEEASVVGFMRREFYDF